MTDRIARDGDVVDPMGMSIESYLRNPVVLWVHDYLGRTPSAGLPIGRTLALDRRPEGIDADFEFLPGDPFAQRVENAWERGFLRTASIGWQSVETVPLPNGRGLCHRRSELLEWSLVPVPADPAASRDIYLAGLRSLGFGDLLGPVEGDQRRAGRARIHLEHPPLATLIAELQDAWDYVKARLGPAGPVSPRVLGPLEALARDLRSVLGPAPIHRGSPAEGPVPSSGSGQALSLAEGSNQPLRDNGDDTADSVDIEAFLRAARQLQALVQETARQPLPLAPPLHDLPLPGAGRGSGG
jgi:hypothetical protein